MNIASPSLDRNLGAPAHRSFAAEFGRQLAIAAGVSVVIWMLARHFGGGPSTPHVIVIRDGGDDDE